MTAKNRRLQWRLYVASILAAGCAPTTPEAPNQAGNIGFRTPQHLPLLSAEHPPPPIAGGTIAASDGIALVGDAARLRALVVNTRTGRFSEIPTEGIPGRAIIDGDTGYMLLRNRAQLLTIDLKATEIIDKTAVCAAPRGLAMHPDGALRVTCLGGELMRITTDSAELLTRLEPDLRDVVIQDGTTYVSWFRSAVVGELDDDGNVTRRFRPEVLVGPRGVPRHGRVGWRLRPAPDGELALVHQTNAPSAVPVEIPGSYGGTQGLPCDGISGTAVTRINPKTGRVRTREIADVVLPVDIALASSTHRLGLMVAGAGTSPDGSTIGTQIDDFEADTQQVSKNCLDGPVFYEGIEGDFEQFDTLEAFEAVEGFGIGQPTAVAFDAERKLYFVFSRQPARLISVGSGGAALRTIELGGDSVADTGHHLFHRDAGGGIACASCHPEGGDDGFGWTFDGVDGVRRTQMLRGGIKGTEPFHWEGDLPDFRALSDEVFSHRMGGLVLKSAHVQLFVDYIDRMPDVKLTKPKAADDPAVARGEALFNDATVGCAGCHIGGTGTDNRSHDVGTGGVFQTPALRSLVQRMPLMHTGCATTLSARFTTECGGGDAHGKTSHLAHAQIADLVRYLDSL